MLVSQLLSILFFLTLLWNPVEGVKNGIAQTPERIDHGRFAFHSGHRLLLLNQAQAGTGADTQTGANGCDSDLGTCVNLHGECWCYFAKGTVPSLVCGYSPTYNEEYFSIDTSAVNEATNIIYALGQTPQNDCTDDFCADDCLSNVCKDGDGCTGEKNQSCPGYIADLPWQRTNRAGIVRCTTMETKTECPNSYPFAYRPSNNFDYCCSTTVDCNGIAWSEGGSQDCCEDDNNIPCPSATGFGCVDNANPGTGTETQIEDDDCVSDLGSCVNLHSECWCYFEKGNVPSSVCGYSPVYNGEYFSIDRSPVNEATSIIYALGQTLQNDCTDEFCADDCLSNVCKDGDGCTGEKNQSCPSYVEDLPWQRTNQAGIVRCRILENIEPSSTPTVTPTSIPTSEPSSTPTVASTSVPTAQPSSAPTLIPTSQPSATPTGVPTLVPTSQPSSTPTVLPTFIPTSQPSSTPTASPTFQHPIFQNVINSLGNLLKSFGNMDDPECIFIPVLPSECPCTDNDSSGCDLAPCTWGTVDFCEADYPLPDGTGSFNVNNCPNGYDVFEKVC